MAKSNLESLLKLCAIPLEGENAQNAKLSVAQQKAFHDVTRELVREVTSPNETVRHQVRQRCTPILKLYFKPYNYLMGLWYIVKGQLLLSTAKIRRNMPY